jgi:transposase
LVKFEQLCQLLLMNTQVDSLLNLPGITVIGSKEVEGYLCFQVQISQLSTNCPHCQKSTKELHQVTWRLVRDLPAFGKAVYLKVPRRKFYCRRCQRYSTERLEFLNRGRLYTKRYEENIYQRVVNSNVEQVGREECLSPMAIQGIFNWVSRQKKKSGQLKESA